MLLIVSYSMFDRDRLPPVVAQAIEDHASFVEDRKPTTLILGDLAQVSAIMEKDLGYPMPVPDLSGTGLTFESGRYCFIEGRRGGAVIYRAEGRPVSFYALDRPLEGLESLKSVATSEGRFFLARSGRYAAVPFKMGDLLCILVSDLTEERMVELAETILRMGRS